MLIKKEKEILLVVFCLNLCIVLFILIFLDPFREQQE